MSTRNRRHYLFEKLKCKSKLERMYTEGYTYDDMVAAAQDEGETISRSSLQRYFCSVELAADRLIRAQEQVKVLAEAVKENPNTEMAEVASQLMLAGLLERVASAEEEFDDMSLKDAGRLISSLSNSTTGRERLKLQYEKMLKVAREQIESELKKELSDQPKLLAKLSEQIDKILTKLIDEK